MLTEDGTAVCLYTVCVQSFMVFSQFTMHDGFGIIFVMEMLSMPFFNSLIQRYCFVNPQVLCYTEIAASVILFGKCLCCVWQWY